MKCSNCKYWGKWKKPKDNVADCDKVDSVIKDKNKTFEIDITADDDSGLQSALLTGGDFGCIHFEEK